MGDNGFTKEELALKSIRDEANYKEEGKDAAAATPNKSPNMKIPHSYQKHVAKLDAQKQAAAMAKNRRNNSGFIPCLYLPYLGGSSKLLIYFHGNAEDVGLAMELLAFVKDMLKVSLNKVVFL